MLFSPDYILFFEGLLCAPGETIEMYRHLFDSRDAKIKRKEFQANYKQILTSLLERYGRRCLLQYPEICMIERGINIDHLIPLSTNVLNKVIRKTIATAGHKVRSESFGSNNLDNLIIACEACNAHKKHRFLSTGEYRRILNGSR